MLSMCARHERALMTQEIVRSKDGNAILRNHLKGALSRILSISLKSQTIPLRPGKPKTNGLLLLKIAMK